MPSAVLGTVAARACAALSKIARDVTLLAQTEVGEVAEPYVAGRGQSSDPSGPSYDAMGLPLIPGLIEVITKESSGPGQRHAHLAAFVGQIAVRDWRGEPGDRTAQASGVGWVRGVEWATYQRRTFVTPA